MKSKKTFKKISLLLACGMLSSVCAIATSCDGDGGENVLKQKPLPIPTGVTINYGADQYTSEDDTVSFSPVEGATQYFVYVYQEGDTKAKVTSGTGTTVEMPTPLAAGTYKVSVVAVGDGVNNTNSNGSVAVDYTLAQATVIQLGKISNLAGDFTENKLTFTGVEHAGQYSVSVYEANSEGVKSGDPILSLTVPAGDSTAVSYDIPVTAQDTLIPGYYVFGVKAQSNSEYYSDGETVETFIVNGGHTYATPEITVEEPENGGIKVTLSNNDAFISGSKFTVNVYDNAEGTGDPVSTSTLTYTQSTNMFGQTTTNNTVGLEVKESDGALVVGGTYYIQLVIEGDGVLYTNTAKSEIKSIETTKAGKGETENSGGGGFPGGGGGGGGNMSITPTTTDPFAAGAEEISVGINFMNNDSDLTGAIKAEANEGSTYSYTLTGVGGMGEAITGTLELKADGSAVLYVGGFGPFGDCNATGTWVDAEGTITVTF